MTVVLRRHMNKECLQTLSKVSGGQNCLGLAKYSLIAWTPQLALKYSQWAEHSNAFTVTIQHLTRPIKPSHSSVYSLQSFAFIYTKPCLPRLMLFYTYGRKCEIILWYWPDVSLLFNSHSEYSSLRLCLSVCSVQHSHWWILLSNMSTQLL